MDNKFRKLETYKSKKRINFKFIRNTNGQSTFVEYSVFIVIFVLAIIAMQPYIIRSLQGGLRKSADSIGSQYEPTKTYVDFNITSRSDIVTNVTVSEAGGQVNTTTVVTTNYDETTRQGTEIVGAF